MSCEESEKVTNQYRAQLITARDAVETAKGDATGSPTPSSIASTSSTWRSPTADSFRSDLTGKSTEIKGKFNSLIGNLNAEIAGEPRKVCPDDDRAERNYAGPAPV